MIKEIRQQKPFIHFGFNRQSITVSVGDEVTIWQDKFYLDDYDYILNLTSGNVISGSLNKSVVSFDNVGVITVSVDIESKDFLTVESSNTLEIIVQLKYSNETVTWGNTTINFNN